MANADRIHSRRLVADFGNGPVEIQVPTVRLNPNDPVDESIARAVVRASNPGIPSEPLDPNNPLHTKIAKAVVAARDIAARIPRLRTPEELSAQTAGDYSRVARINAELREIMRKPS